jgi:predicted membrane protein
MEKQKLPNGLIVLIFGILSILTCCFYGIPGLIFGVVALILAQKDLSVFNENPEIYSNVSQIKIGRILAIIGVVLSVLYITLVVYFISTFGYEALQDETLLKEAIREKWGIES